jgi:hypothetical protein
MYKEQSGKSLAEAKEAVEALTPRHFAQVNSSETLRPFLFVTSGATGVPNCESSKNTIISSKRLIAYTVTAI